MLLNLRPISLIAAGMLSLVGGCATTEPEVLDRIVLNPPAPERPRKVVTRARPAPSVAPIATPAIATIPAAAANPTPAPDDTGLTQAQKEELFERFVATRAREAPQ